MLAKLVKYIHIINENKQVYLILAKLVSIAPPWRKLVDIRFINSQKHE